MQINMAYAESIGKAERKMEMLMLGRNMRALVVLVLVLVVAVVADAQSNEYLSAHNSARRAVGAGIPDLRWDNELQNYATNWAKNRANTARCALSHSGGRYGENIYWSSGASKPADAVRAWVDEKQYYNYGSNSCAAGRVCGHYTQVVWRNTQFVGCGSANCPGGGTFVVCSYNPPGNFNGQRPYLQAHTTSPGVQEA